MSIHSPPWDGNQPSDKMDETLEQWLQESGMSVLNVKARSGLIEGLAMEILLIRPLSTRAN